MEDVVGEAYFLSAQGPSFSGGRGLQAYFEQLNWSEDGCPQEGIINRTGVIGDCDQRSSRRSIEYGPPEDVCIVDTDPGGACSQV